MTFQAGEVPPLSVRRAFVVQFRAETNVQEGRFIGRVEHVASGQVAHFGTLEELLTFIARVLGSTGLGVIETA